MVPKIVFLRPKQKVQFVKNGQNQRVATLYKTFVDFGFSVEITEVSRLPRPREYRIVSNLLATPNSILALTSFILLPWCLAPAINQKIKIIDMMDSLKKTRVSEKNLLKRALGKFESLISSNFKNEHIRTYISDYDRQSDYKITPKNIESFVIPNSISVNKLGKNSNLDRLVFVGDLNYPENRIMLSELCPALTSAGMKLHVYGAGENSIQHKFENHIFHGSCDDTELYQPGDLHLAPVRNMHGLSSKVFHALTRGIPVLTTVSGANGINDCLGMYIENDIGIWPEVIRGILLKSQNSSLEVQWNGFKCDHTELIKSSLNALLTKQKY